MSYRVVLKHDAFEAFNDEYTYHQSAEEREFAIPHDYDFDDVIQFLSMLNLNDVFDGNTHPNFNITITHTPESEF